MVLSITYFSEYLIESKNTPSSVKIARLRTTSAICGFWKTYESVLFQIAQETMLLPIKHDKKITVPKKVIECKLLYYLFSPLWVRYLEITPLLANQYRESFSYIY